MGGTLVLLQSPQLRVDLVAPGKVTFKHPNGRATPATQIPPRGASRIQVIKVKSIVRSTLKVI